MPKPKEELEPQVNADEYWCLEYDKEFFIHLIGENEKGENEKFHQSLIIRVNRCPSVVPFLFLG